MGTGVDIHRHLWTEPLLAASAARCRPPRLRRSGGSWILQLEGEPESALPSSAPDVVARAALVSDDGLERALIALSSPLGIEALPRGEAEPLLDAYRAGVSDLPAAFGWWASVALDDPEPAEVDAALDAGAAGLCLPASALGSLQGWRAAPRCSSGSRNAARRS